MSVLTPKKAKTKHCAHYGTSINFWRCQRGMTWMEMASLIEVNHNVLLRSAKASYRVFESADGHTMAVGPKQSRLGGVLATDKLELLASKIGVTLQQLLTPPKQE